MSNSDALLQNVMPRTILSSDGYDVWSSRISSGSSPSSEYGPYSSAKELRELQQNGKFSDYFGLASLIDRVKISEDNPLLDESRHLFNNMHRPRRVSWESDSIDSGVVLSPTMSKSPFSFGSNGVDVNKVDVEDISTGMKPTILPSMRLSKAERAHIISGAWQRNVNNRFVGQFAQIPNKTLLLPLTSPSQSVVPSSQMNAPPSTTRPPLSFLLCVFCRNNNECEDMYRSHVLKDSDGRTLCPILRAYTCPICKANGDKSHTIKYCPMNPNSRVSSSIG